MYRLVSRTSIDLKILLVHQLHRSHHGEVKHVNLVAREVSNTEINQKKIKGKERKDQIKIK